MIAALSNMSLAFRFPLMHPTPSFASIPVMIPAFVAQVITPELASGWERAGIGAVGLLVSFVCFQSLKRVYENAQRSADIREKERARILQGILDTNKQLVEHLVTQDKIHKAHDEGVAQTIAVMDSSNKQAVANAASEQPKQPQ